MKILFVTALVFFPVVASASVAVNAGAIEIVGVPNIAHYGVYPYVGLSTTLEYKKVFIIPGLSVGMSPEFNRWGLVATAIVDIPMNDYLGLDTVLAVLHDQDGSHWGSASYYGEIGYGISLTLGKLILSPSVSLAVPFSSGGGWSVVPGLNVSYNL